MNPESEERLLKSLDKIVKAFEHLNELTEDLHRHATKPRPLFMDYESGFRAGALSERLGLTDAEEEEEAIQENEKTKNEAFPAVYVEGVIAHGDVDPDGDQFVLDGISYDDYLVNGYVANRCDVRPEITELIGEPVSIKRKGDELVMMAKIFDQPMVQNLLALAASEGIDPCFGFALAGVIIEKEGPEDGGRILIKKLRICSVALVPADKLSDPRCVCRIVKEVDDLPIPER